MKFKDLFNKDWTVNWYKIDGLGVFLKLSGTPQSVIWHAEGDALTHTKLVTDAMSVILNENGVKCGTDEWIMCMVSAICHDLGKAETTKWSEERNDYSAKNHSIVGDRITRRLFFEEDIIQREKVCYMVRHHMTLHHIFDEGKDSAEILKKLSHGIVPIKYMVWLNVADSKGSDNKMETEESIRYKVDRILAKTAIMSCYDRPYSFVDKSQMIRNFISYDGDVVNNTNDFCVYILCGFPGAGKTTYLNKYLSDKKIVSRDIVRCELNVCGATFENDKKVIGSKKDEEKVTEICTKQIIELCENKESFVYDNTNLKQFYRTELLKTVMKYNPKVQIIYIEAYDLDVCRERRKRDIPPPYYDSALMRFDFPQLWECDELVIAKQGIDGTESIYKFKGNVVPNYNSLGNTILNDLKITRGAMILDGYDCYDSCIKYMDELISNYETVISFYETSDEIF